MIRLVGLGRSRYSGVGGVIPETWTDIIQLKINESYAIGLKADGTLLLAESNRGTYKWYKNAVKELESIKNIVALIGSLAVCDDGTVISLSYQECKPKKMRLFDSLEELESRFAAFAENEREIIRRKEAQIVALKSEQRNLNEEQHTLNSELAELKGLFSGKRRREIETRLAEINTRQEKIAQELKNLTW